MRSIPSPLTTIENNTQANGPIVEPHDQEKAVALAQANIMAAFGEPTTPAPTPQPPTTPQIDTNILPQNTVMPSTPLPVNPQPIAPTSPTAVLLPAPRC